MKPPPQIDPSWKEILEEEWNKSYLVDLALFLKEERACHMVYPPADEVFNSLNHTPFDQVKVVIIGQDPYHGPGQAHGLSFSVQHGVAQPPSLKNIFKEIQDDLGIPLPDHGCLTSWADQGVLLLNNVLTVRAREPHSHAKKGWEQFTDAIVKRLCERDAPVIFVLWGKAAQEKCHHILSQTTNRHFVLTAPHPSPYSAHSGFFGCHHFSKINELLTSQGKQPIDWSLACEKSRV